MLAAIFTDIQTHGAFAAIIGLFVLAVFGGVKPPPFSRA